MKYILDLTACRAEKYQQIFGDWRKIQIIRGEHQKTWDVVMSALPQETLDSILENRRQAYRFHIDAEFKAMLEMPIGFDPESIPAGAEIKEVSEEEYAEANGNDAQTA